MAKLPKDLSSIVAEDDLVGIEAWILKVEGKIARRLVLGQSVASIPGLSVAVRVGGMREIVLRGSDAARAMLVAHELLTQGYEAEVAEFALLAGNFPLAKSFLTKCQPMRPEIRKRLFLASFGSTNAGAPSWLLDQDPEVSTWNTMREGFDASAIKATLSGPNGFLAVDRILNGGVRDEHRQALESAIASFAVLDAAVRTGEIERVKQMIALLTRVRAGALLAGTRKGLCCDASGWRQFATTTDAATYHDILSLLHAGLPERCAELAQQLALNRELIERRDLLKTVMRYCTQSVHSRFNLLVYYLTIGEFEAAEVAIESGADVNSFGAVTVLKQVLTTTGWATSSTENALAVLRFLKAHGYRFQGPLQFHFPHLMSSTVTERCDAKVLLRETIEMGIRPTESALRDAITHAYHPAIAVLLDFPECQLTGRDHDLVVALGKPFQPTFFSHIGSEQGVVNPPAASLSSLRLVLQAQPPRVSAQLATLIVTRLRSPISEGGVSFLREFGADFSHLDKSLLPRFSEDARQLITAAG